ncbi:MAG TPA: dephospho-CoA kinase [Fimbriimonadaceae bacterium]|nr:dephospho-CoA kinase [Fimbriimonadaceae bacterium]
MTGGIAEGKSTVLGYLSEMGYPIESADRIAREVFSSEPVQRQIAELLGFAPPVSSEDLRSKLRDPSLRRAVNTITHPRILEGLRSSHATFFEIPLLIETCLQGTFDRVWVVTCGMEEQRRRLAERLGSEAAAESMIGTQLTSRIKIPFGDRVIRTNQAELSVKRFVTLAALRDLR